MIKYHTRIIPLLLVGMTALACDVADSSAGAPTDLTLQSSVESPVQSKKSAYQRRKEAKKHLQEALEARKAQKLAKASDGKGGAK